MTNVLLRLVVGLLMAGISSSVAQANEADVIVDLRSHRADIRVALLHATPLRSNAREVLDFISKQLQRSENTPAAVTDKPADGPAAEGSNQRGVKTIRVYLGQYYDHPEVVFFSAPMVMQKEVSAQWAFDARDRLVDIFVDKTTSVY